MKLTKQKLENLIQEALSQNNLNKLADLFLSGQMEDIRQAGELADSVYNDEVDNFWYEENSGRWSLRVSITFFKDATELYNAIKERYSGAPIDERITIELHDNLDDVKEGYSPQGSLTIIFSDVFNEKWYEL